MGIKPVRGGRPPRERRVKGTIAVIRGAFTQVVARALIFVALLNLMVKKAAEVITRYVERAKSVRAGANWAIIIIHPRCAIEE